MLMRYSMTVGIIVSALSFGVTNTYSMVKTGVEHLWKARDSHIAQTFDVKKKELIVKDQQLRCTEVPSEDRP